MSVSQLMVLVFVFVVPCIISLIAFRKTFPGKLWLVGLSSFVFGWMGLTMVYIISIFKTKDRKREREV